MQIPPPDRKLVRRIRNNRRHGLGLHQFARHTRNIGRRHRLGLATGAKGFQINQFLTLTCSVSARHHIHLAQLQHIIFGVVLGRGGINQVGTSGSNLATFFRHTATDRR